MVQSLKDIFDKQKNQHKVIFNPQKPILNHELNLLQDIALFKNKNTNLKALGTNFSGEDFLVIKSHLPNEIIVKKGVFFHKGESLFLENDFIISNLTTPTSNRIDCVYLEWSLQNINVTQDPSMLEPGFPETTSQDRLVLNIKVAEDSSTPTPSLKTRTVYHPYFDSSNIKIILQNHELQNNAPIKLTSSGTLPSGLNSVDTYYVNLIDENNFSLKDISSNIVSFSDSGTGNHTITYLNTEINYINLALLERVASDSLNFKVLDQRHNSKLNFIIEGCTSYLVSELQIRVKEGFCFVGGIYFNIEEDSPSITPLLGDSFLIKHDSGLLQNTVSLPYSFHIPLAKIFNNGLNLEIQDLRQFKPIFYSNINTENKPFQNTKQFKAAQDIEAFRVVSLDSSVININPESDLIYIENHNFNTKDQVLLSSEGSLPLGVYPETFYYVYKVDNNHIRLAKRCLEFYPSDIDILTNSIKIANHAYNDGDILLFHSNHTAPRGVSVNETYVITVLDSDNILINSVNIEDQGLGTHCFLSDFIDFNENYLEFEFFDVDLLNNKIVFSSNHYLNNLDPVRFSSNALLPSPLTPEKVYYVSVLDNLSIRISENNTGSPLVTLNDQGTGTHLLQGPLTYNTDLARIITESSFSGDTILVNNHKLRSDDLVLIAAVSGQLPSPLINEGIYFVEKVDDNNIKLKTTISSIPLLYSGGTGQFFITGPMTSVNAQGSAPIFITDLRVRPSDKQNPFQCIGMSYRNILKDQIEDFITFGDIHNKNWNFIPNLEVYVDSLGNITQTPISTDYSKLIGIAYTTDTLFFNPNNHIIKINSNDLDSAYLTLKNGKIATSDRYDKINTFRIKDLASEPLKTTDSMFKIYKGSFYLNDQVFSLSQDTILDLGYLGLYITTPLADPTKSYNKAVFTLDKQGSIQMYESEPSSSYASVPKPSFPNNELPLVEVKFQDTGLGIGGSIADITWDSLTDLRPFLDISDRDTDFKLTYFYDAKNKYSDFTPNALDKFILQRGTAFFNGRHISLTENIIIKHENMDILLDDDNEINLNPTTFYVYLDLSCPNSISNSDYIKIFTVPPTDILAIDLLRYIPLGFYDYSSNRIIKDTVKTFSSKYWAHYENPPLKRKLFAGENLTKYEIVTINPAGDAVRANASVGSTLNKGRAICLESLDTGEGDYFLFKGFLTDSSWSWSPNLPLYLDTSLSGINITQTKSSVNGTTLQVIGYALSSNLIFIDLEDTKINPLSEEDSLSFKPVQLSSNSFYIGKGDAWFNNLYVLNNSNTVITTVSFSGTYYIYLDTSSYSLINNIFNAAHISILSTEPKDTDLRRYIPLGYYTSNSSSITQVFEYKTRFWQFRDVSKPVEHRVTLATEITVLTTSFSFYNFDKLDVKVNGITQEETSCYVKTQPNNIQFTHKIKKNAQIVIKKI